MTVPGFVGKVVVRRNWKCRPGCTCRKHRELSDSERESRRLGGRKSSGNRTGRALIDETGNVHGRLTVLRMVPRSLTRRPTWLCRCTCGSFTEVTGVHLRNGSIRSCGCLQADVMAGRA